MFQVIKYFLTIRQSRRLTAILMGAFRMTQFVYAIESLSVWVGRAFGWCILVLTFSVSYEVFVRYVLNSPTVWAFDMMIQMYGALFLMAGPYALAQDTHVRGDVLYRLFPVIWQARIDFVLYLLFFFPGILALFWYGWEIAQTAGATRK